jgi:undecaprenyl-diphosphatase
MAPQAEEPRREQVLAWDAGWSRELTRLRRLKPLRWIALVLAHSGDSPLWLAVGGGLLLWGGTAGSGAGRRILMATILGGGTAWLLKWVFRRQRPGASFAGLYARVDRHAFPSGHATRAGCVTVVLAPLLPPWGAGLLITWAGLVCLARVILGVHYLMDVLVGLAIGGALGLLLLAPL